ncbi:unnamed protein product [Parajaminaea phylloscopi]
MTLVFPSSAGRQWLPSRIFLRSICDLSSQARIEAAIMSSAAATSAARRTFARATTSSVSQRALSSAAASRPSWPGRRTSTAPTAQRNGARRCQSAWTAAVNAAHSGTAASLNIPSDPPSPASSSKPSAKAASPFDPIPSISNDLDSLRSNISMLLGSGHPSLDSVAKYYFQAEGKHIRPLIVLLMSAATNGISPIFAKGRHANSEEQDLTGVDEPLSPSSILNDFNPSISRPSSSSHEGGVVPESSQHPVLATQRRLAEIAEMIHVASLLHDDVIDESELRRGAPSSPSSFGNKLSILGGDFLLGRASVALARLRDNEVVELLATVISNLVEGEVMQMKGVDVGALQGSGLASFWTSEEDIRAAATTSRDGSEQALPGPTPEHFTSYLQKTYLKTASLMAKSARAATILGGCGKEALADWRRSRGIIGDEQGEEAVVAQCARVRDAAYSYGRNLGIAFQLVDDLLDFKSTSVSFGKPSLGADLRLGLATAPVLYAWQEFPGPEHGMKEMVERKFEGEGDVEKALALVNKSQGLARTANLARHHADAALQELQVLPESEAKEALQRLVGGVLDRVK